MTVGMTVNVPKTEAQRLILRKLVLLLDEAAVHATDAGLFIQAMPGAEFLGAISEGLMRTWRRSNVNGKEDQSGNLSTQT